LTIDCRPYEARLVRTRADLALTLREVEAQQNAIAAATTEVACRQAGLVAAIADLARRETQPPLADAEIARAEEERAAAAVASILLEERDAERPFRMGTTAVVHIRGFPAQAAPAAPAR
jgi:multidrug resistance efflux pump